MLSMFDIIPSQKFQMSMRKLLLVSKRDQEGFSRREKKGVSFSFPNLKTALDPPVFWGHKEMTQSGQ